MIGTAVIVETREIPNFRELVLNHVEYSGFNPMVWHGAYNEKYVKEQLEGVDCIFINNGLKELSAHGYNLALTSAYFWKQIPTERVLVFQHDSWMLRMGIEQFSQYDFVGSPLYHIKMPCMNGGISLRNKSKMIEVIEKVPYDVGINEDCWFCLGIQKVGGLLPDRETAMKFGVETIATTGSVCCHAIEKYLSPEICNHIKNQYK